MPEETKNIAVSFNFKKTIVSKVDETKVIQEKEESNEEYLNEINEKVLNKKPPKEKKLVIPLINKNKWILPKNSGEDNTNAETDLQQLAAKEIIKESAVFLEKTIDEDCEEEFNNLEVPLLLKNKVPDGFETDEKLNVDLRPEEATLQDYEEVPIKAFGMAMLRGMGWDPKVGIGKTFKQNVKVLETSVRPRGLGLGASATLNNKSNSNSNVQSKEEDFEVKKGALVQVQGGSHKKKYGVIEGIDADNALCLVKFALGGKTASVGEFNLKVVSKSEYVKFGKDLSRLTKAHENAEKLELLNGHSKKKESKDVTERDDRNREIKQRKRSPNKRENKAENDYEERSRHKKKKKRHEEERYSDVESKSKRKHKKKKHHAEESSSNTERRSRRKTWLMPNLRVRMIDEDYKKGKYYREKLLVVDVFNKDGDCSCETPDGMLLDNLHQDMLETVVPKSSSEAYVIITTGGKLQHDGKLAKILEKDKENSTAFLQLIEDRDVALEVPFDDICEYAGDVEAFEHF